MTSTLLVLGRRVRPIETVETCGALLGRAKSWSYRHWHAWPHIEGAEPAQILVVPFAEMHGLPVDYDVDGEVQP